jgi:hypothetical protein
MGGEALFSRYLSHGLPEALSDFHGLAHVPRLADDPVLPVQVREERGELLFSQGVGLGLLRRHGISLPKNPRSLLPVNIPTIFQEDVWAR